MYDRNHITYLSEDRNQTSQFCIQAKLNFARFSHVCSLETSLFWILCFDKIVWDIKLL